MTHFHRLLGVIEPRREIFIQTHDFPDFDSVASAFGLQHLLSASGISSRLVYSGEIQREALRRMCREIGIDIRPSPEAGIREQDAIVIVDGCKGSKNVTDLPGDEIGVIDHHQVASPESVPFVDVRPHIGACSTMIFSYFQEAGLAIPQKTATALMIGINMDTALLTRGVSREDIQAYADLYTTADIRMENAILRNYIQTKDLGFYRYALENVEIRDGIAFCFFPYGCNQNLLGILGDFFIGLEEADFVILCAQNDGTVNLSLRSEREEWNASFVIQEVLRGIGFGGGHADMAGGIIRGGGPFDARSLDARFRETLGRMKR